MLQWNCYSFLYIFLAASTLSEALPESTSSSIVMTNDTDRTPYHHRSPWFTTSTMTTATFSTTSTVKGIKEKEGGPGDLSPPPPTTTTTSAIETSTMKTTISRTTYEAPS